MLDSFQQKRAWENMLAAETRALYFADLASRYTRQKQWITGMSFFLASGAAASLVGKLPVWVPTATATVVALVNAYSIAVGLDRKAKTMARLHSDWAQIANDYGRLWSHTDDEDAEARLDELIRQEKEPSELATTDAQTTKNCSASGRIAFSRCTISRDRMANPEPITKSWPPMPKQPPPPPPRPAPKPPSPKK